MNKVICEGNHFFDLEKFSVCPICGRGVGTQPVKKNGMSSAITSIRKSRLVGKDDKTAIMEDTETKPDVPGKGKAGGIVWNFQSDNPKANTDKPDSVQDIDRTMIEPGTQGNEAVPASGAENVQNQSAPADTESAKQAATSLMQDVANTGHGRVSSLPKTVSYYDQVQKNEDHEEVEIVLPTGWLVCVRGAHKGQTFQCKENKNRIGRGTNCSIVPEKEFSISREVHATLYFDPKYRRYYLSDGDSDKIVRVNDEVLCGGKTELHAYDKIELGQAEFVFVPLCGERFSWEDYKA